MSYFVHSVLASNSPFYLSSCCAIYRVKPLSFRMFFNSFLPKLRPAIKSDLDVPIDDFFQEFDSDFNGLNKIEDEEFVYKSSDVLVQSNLEVPIIVQWPESKVSFEFYSKLGSVVFYVVFVAAPAEGCEVTEECVLTLLRPEKYGSYDEPITGEFTPPCEGVLFFIWDNAHDWLSVKKITYTIQVHQPSFSLIDNIRCEKARELLPHTIDELNHDYDLREDMKNAARNSSSSVAFLSMQIKHLQDRLDDKRRALLLLEQEERQFQNIIDLNRDMREGLHIRCLSKSLLLHVFAYLFDPASDNSSEFSNICTHWSSLYRLLLDHRSNVNGFLDDLLSQERQNRVVLLSSERKQLVLELKQQSSTNQEHHNTGASLSSTAMLPTGLSVSSEVPQNSTEKSQTKRQSRSIRDLSIDHNSSNNNLLQRALSRTRSRSLSTVSCVSSASPLPGEESSKRQVHRNDSFKITGPMGQKAGKKRSSSSHSSDSDVSYKMDDNIQIRTGRQPRNPLNVHATPKKSINNINPNQDSELLAQVTKKMELVLSPDPLPVHTSTNNNNIEVANHSPKKKKHKYEKKTLEDSLSSSDEEAKDFDILPTIRKVAFALNSHNDQPAQLHLAAESNINTTVDKDLKEEEVQRPSLTRSHGHNKHHRSAATNMNNIGNAHMHRRRSSHQPIPVPEELKGKIVSLKDASKLLPSLTSHPHLQTPPASTPVNKNVAVPQNNALPPQSNAARLEKQQRQVFEFISQANEQMSILYRKRRELKHLIRTWHEMQADMTEMLKLEEEKEEKDDKHGSIAVHENDLPENQESQSLREKHGELVSLHEKYRQVSLHLRICNEKLAAFLKRLSSHPELLQQALQQLSQLKHISATATSAAAAEDHDNALGANESAKSKSNRRRSSSRRLSKIEEK